LNRELLNPDVQAFIIQHENDDVTHLILKHKTIHGLPTSLIAEQILGRRKAKEKLPTYYLNPQILYPAGINLEQSSSELTAKFKLLFLKHILPENLTLEAGADLTGGFGVDAFCLSSYFPMFHYVEPNQTLVELVKHNHHLLGFRHIEYHTTNAENFLQSFHQRLSLVFIDPSRRDTNAKKVFALKDCVPDVTMLQQEIFTKTNLLLIKAAPMLDIHHALQELKSTKKVIVVSVKNECKELLFLCEQHYKAEPSIEAVNIIHENQLESFEFKFSDEKATEVQFSDPQTYLYEPNASIQKAGAFKSIAVKFNVLKLHSSTHLYTSEMFIENFPGRIFKILKLVKPDPKILNEYFPDGKANITVRNYPMSVDELKRVTGLKDGGDKFLIGFSGVSKKFLAVAIRLK
jgi:16S rRNA G966 N2-methylase RsmD